MSAVVRLDNAVVALFEAAKSLTAASDYAQGVCMATAFLGPELMQQRAWRQTTLLGRLVQRLERLGEDPTGNRITPYPDLQQFKKMLLERCIPAHRRIGPNGFAQAQHPEAHELLNVSAEGVDLQCVRLAHGELGQQRFLIRVHPVQESEPLLLELTFAPPPAQRPSHCAERGHQDGSPQPPQQVNADFHQQSVGAQA